MFTPVTSEACMSLKFWSNSPVIHISANVFPQQPMPSVVTVLMNKQFAVNPWNNNPVPSKNPSTLVFTFFTVNRLLNQLLVFFKKFYSDKSFPKTSVTVLDCLCRYQLWVIGHSNLKHAVWLWNQPTNMNGLYTYQTCSPPWLLSGSSWHSTKGNAGIISNSL